ncbi:MAG: NADH:flavin oxidoreductase [Myxococcales bacterium]|nr:NADH:flavin oxidoreductase [Myxococcales bacterium]
MSARLTDPIQIGSIALPNRLYRAPVLEGAGSAPDPASVYAAHFVPNVEAGLGLVIQGNTVVLPEGRTSPGMSTIGERERMLALAPLTRAVHDAGGKIVIQLGHGGMFALEGWHTTYAPGRSAPPLAPSRPPLWLRLANPVETRVLTTREIEALVERFGIVASWAREAGYDGVQLAGSNAKLLHQFLSPFYNRRTDRYGGDTLGRTTFIREVREAIAREAGADYPVLLKYTALEYTPFGKALTLEDGVTIARVAAEAGFAALTPVAADVLPNTSICRGEFPGPSFDNPGMRRRLLAATGTRYRSVLIHAGMWLAARKYPFAPVWNREVFRAVKRAVDIPVFAVGGIRTPLEAAEILRAGDADMIGIGRPFYAEPALARRFLTESALPMGAKAACESCNRCIVPQMLGMPGVCYNPAIHKIRPRDPSGRPAPARTRKVA